jgi:MFS family permease
VEEPEEKITFEVQQEEQKTHGSAGDDGLPRFSWAIRLWRWFAVDFLGIIREMRWSYLPPLMVYLAAGVSGFTGIIETFFVKENLGLSAAFLAGLAFWAGIPWTLKMPLGHLVDLFWHRKSFFVYLGAVLMAGSLLIMLGLTGYRSWMVEILPADVWYVVATILSPVGFVLQDVVADAMTVEAVPLRNEDGSPIPEDALQRMHITVQTLGRIAIVGGVALVAGMSGWLAKSWSYAAMYRWALLIPVISVLGVLLGQWNLWQKRRVYLRSGMTEEEVRSILRLEKPRVTPNRFILGGSGAFVAVSLLVGLSNLPAKMEIICFGSLAIIIYIMAQLLRDLDPLKRREIIAIAIIIFIFRSVPGTGAGAGWWEIDILKFDESFFGTLRQISSILAIMGMFALRGWMSRHPIPYLVVFLSVYNTIMMLPYVGMYYGLHEWTERVLGVGPRTIALIDTMADSPMGQVAMVPMLAWIAREAPHDQKATYFAVMAAFTNVALSVSSLMTNYLNVVFVIERGNYSELGGLFITVVAIGLVVPVMTVIVVNQWVWPGRSRRVGAT